MDTPHQQGPLDHRELAIGLFAITLLMFRRAGLTPCDDQKGTY